MKGIELLKKVRSDPRMKGLPFVLITAESEKSQVIEALKLDVSNYVVKPFTPAQLKEKLETVYKKHAAPAPAKTA
jgi:two-component system chemotaxis response regulator CheY